MTGIHPVFGGRNVLLISRFEGERHAHAALRRRALERLGCGVVVVDLQPGGWLARLTGGDAAARITRAVAEHRPELVLALGPVLPDAGVVRRLRADGPAPWVLWWGGDDGTEPDAAAWDAYTQVWVADSDLAARVPGARYLPHGCDPSVHRPMSSRDEFRANVVFVGEATPHRERLLSEVVEFGLAVWGPGWRKTRLRDYCRGDALAVEDYVRASAGASIALNLHREGPEGRVPSAAGCNARTFELAAMGVAQVVDDRIDLPSQFVEAEELAVFRDPAELKPLVRDLLHDRPAAAALAAAARRRALSEHTYVHRLRRLLDDAEDAA
ncbi:MAG TPA: glycosyltransferase [Gemmatimonadales bacterium]|nr:glycosyltransferase [Gemmatimonadales bacterium]